MNTNVIKSMAAIPYLLVLLIVINGSILGNYDLYFFGVQLSLITLIPYLIYHFVNRDHAISFIAIHTQKAMSIFFKYFILTIILGIAMNIVGLGIATANIALLFTSGKVGLLLILPLIIVIVYAIISTTLGSIRAFKLILPNKEQWKPQEAGENETEIT
jgi:hypothetical protein